MVPLTMLWLPILVATVLVFIASNILWMALPFWHGSDYRRADNEKTIVDALANASSGQYVVPRMDWRTMSAEEREAAQRGPAAFMLVRNPSRFSFGRTLTLYFLYVLVVVIFDAYITGRTRAAGTHYLEVFRVAGAVGFVGFGFRSIPDAIWYGKPWSVAVKEMIDGLIYGLLIAGAFGWLWPR